LIGATTLAELLDQSERPTLLDVRWSLRGGGRAEYEQGHLRGAVFADLDRDLCGAPGAGGRHPLPVPDALQTALRRLGVVQGRPVVVYDAGGPVPTGAAARAWWTLRWAGVDDVRVLDGGYAAWIAAGLPISVDVPAPAEGDVVVRPGGMPVWEPGGGSVTLLDARVPERYSGAAEPVDPIAGHIPGAVNLPAQQTVEESGLMRSPAELRALASSEHVAAYCGSGVTAAQVVLALHEAGIDTALYVGSWSHWITDPDRPVATGEQPVEQPVGGQPVGGQPADEQPFGERR
jgi:thiosulfate/3-mercaptopyruvate sulfurtransferase